LPRFTPPAFERRGLVSVALFVALPRQGVTLHPALRSPDFPLRNAQRLPGRLPVQFYPRAGLERTQPHPITLFVAMVIGGALGAWISSMVGASVPNSRLKRFDADIAAGKVLLMVDVPLRAVERIRDIVLARHPEAVPAGQVRPYPVFP
jgi:hypothetical protein